MRQPTSLQRRHNSRSLCSEASEAKHDFPSYESRFELGAFHCRVTPKLLGTIELESISIKPRRVLPADRQSYFQSQTRKRRQQCESDTSWSFRPALASRSCQDKADTSSPNKAQSHKPRTATEPVPLESATSDAPASGGSSTKLLCGNLPHSVPNEIHETKVLEQILTQVKHPAQAEWEQLWYHSTVAAYQKIALHFPTLHLGTADSTLGQSIAEPTLNISKLNKEDQAIFKDEECISREPFAPNSEADIAQRQRRAAQASDQRQRLALLLGFPTFDEYIEQKRQAQQRSCKNTSQPSKRQLKRQAKFAEKSEKKRPVKVLQSLTKVHIDEGYTSAEEPPRFSTSEIAQQNRRYRPMTHESSQAAPKTTSPVGAAEHRPLVVGLTKPPSARAASTMASNSDTSALNKEIDENVKENTSQAAPSEADSSASAAQRPKKEKAPKQPKPQKAAAPTAPTSPALIDLRVGHILRAIAHPNADSLYVSTIAMGDPEGAEHTQVDEETGKVVRTVCSGLNGLVPLEEMQDRKVIVVANLKPVNMRSIKSAAMVLAASPKQPEGADPHASDRVVELVSPPEGAEAGDKVYFEGWAYGDGRGPEKQLNPKKKQWEAIQPGFYTSDDLVVGFDAEQCEEVDSSDKGNLVVEGKGVCKVKTLKGAVVR